MYRGKIIFNWLVFCFYICSTSHQIIRDKIAASRVVWSALHLLCKETSYCLLVSHASDSDKTQNIDSTAIKRFLKLLSHSKEHSLRFVALCINDTKIGIVNLGAIFVFASYANGPL